MGIEKEYKYYFIFKKDTGDLFAYTDNKIYIQEFKKSRDMNRFYVKKQYINRKTVNDLAANIPKKYLVCKELPTKPKGSIISIVLTQYEYEGLISQGNYIFFNKIRQNTHLDFSILKDEYYDALNNLGYGIYFSIWKGDLVLSDIFEYISPDYVNIFIHYFYNEK